MERSLSGPSRHAQVPDAKKRAETLQTTTIERLIRVIRVAVIPGDIRHHLVLAVTEVCRSVPPKLAKLSS